MRTAPKIVRAVAELDECDFCEGMAPRIVIRGKGRSETIICRDCIDTLAAVAEEHRGEEESRALHAAMRLEEDEKEQGR